MRVWYNLKKINFSLSRSFYSWLSWFLIVAIEDESFSPFVLCSCFDVHGEKSIKSYHLGSITQKKKIFNQKKNEHQMIRRLIFYRFFFDWLKLLFSLMFAVDVDIQSIKRIFYCLKCEFMKQRRWGAVDVKYDCCTVK